MNFILIAVIIFLTNDFNHARKYHRVSSRVLRETATSNDETSAEQTNDRFYTEESEEISESKPAKNKKNKDQTNSSSQESESRYPFEEEKSGLGLNQAYICSKLKCPNEDLLTPVCACNFVTGKVATFQNKCDSKKHNCRFDTNFKVILNMICPWEFSSRRNNQDYVFDYRDSKYYNN